MKKILLDENLPKPLKNDLSEHEVWTVREKRWQGKKNGELFALAIPEFDVFITADQNIQYQQNLANYDIAVIFLVAVENTVERYKPMMPRVLIALETIQKGDVVRIEE